ncbi:MAG: zf-HC2 domain-containing protein [Candidatus Eisenbacteria bacterium]|nr:zf-HC2 domain-containing protein [Candidatus Eisenbacteria bacterium]
MFNCDDVIQLLTEYVDSELEPDTKALLESHFGACPACDQFLKSFRRTVELTGEFRCEDIPEEVSIRLHSFLEERLRTSDQEGSLDEG